MPCGNSDAIHGGYWFSQLENRDRILAIAPSDKLEFNLINPQLIIRLESRSFLYTWSVLDRRIEAINYLSRAIRYQWRNFSKSSDIGEEWTFVFFKFISGNLLIIETFSRISIAHARYIRIDRKNISVCGEILLNENQIIANTCSAFVIYFRVIFGLLNISMELASCFQRYSR